MVYRFVSYRSHQQPSHALPSKHHPSFGLSGLLFDDQKEKIKINMSRTERPLRIQATNALGKTCKRKRKWGETTEHAGSKHLMECPTCWANRLLQIEKNSRCLNRATWNISSCSFSQFSIGKEGEGEGNLTQVSLLFGAAQVFFFFSICNQLWKIELKLDARVSERNVNIVCIDIKLE